MMEAVELYGSGKVKGLNGSLKEVRFIAEDEKIGKIWKTIINQEFVKKEGEHK